MDTPPQTRWSEDTNRHIPAEIMEEILLNLPVKSLLRFSSASKSWNSIIHEASFSKKLYRRGQERIIFGNPSNDEFFSCSLSAVLSNSPTEIEEATWNYVCPIYPSQGKKPLRVIDVCHGLWFVEHRNDKTMFVWNPSTGEYRKLEGHIGYSACLYGLGYDSAADDYKLLKICNGDSKAVTLYSLRSNSWRKIKPFPGNIRGIGISNPRCCVHGKLHWPYQKEIQRYDYVIVSFDLSTEEYGEFSLPPEYFPTIYEVGNLGVICTVSSLRGNLCLSVNYLGKGRFVMWEMEEYGVVESWTKKLDFDYSRISGIENRCYRLRPFYMCKYGQILIYSTPIYGGVSGVLLMKKDGETLFRENFGKKVYGSGFVYVESLVSPAMYVARPAS